MIKVFTLNKNKKIELSPQELETLLNDAYYEGITTYHGTYVYTTPHYNLTSPTYDPWQVTCTAGNPTDSYYTTNTGDKLNEI